MSAQIGVNAARVAHICINFLVFHSPGQCPSKQYICEFRASICLEGAVGSLGKQRCNKNAQKGRVRRREP